MADLENLLETYSHVMRSIGPISSNPLSHKNSQIFCVLELFCVIIFNENI